MKSLILSIASLALAAAGLAAEPARRLDKANVLPLALSDDFSFRKTKTYYYDPRDPAQRQQTFNQMLQFERQRLQFGAITQVDRRERYGTYFTFYWRAKRLADVRVRLEFRTKNLGSYVQARDVEYTAAKGTLKAEFAITGDDYEQDGGITAWRAVVIEGGKIVALNQSFLWN